MSGRVRYFTNRIKMAEQSGKWKNDLFDCLEIMDNTCCLACCCPCIVYGKTRQRFAKENCCGACCLCSLLPCLFLVKTRGDIREKYGIEGSCIGDCCTHLCCGCCALVQESREVRAHVGNDKTPKMYAH